MTKIEIQRICYYEIVRNPQPKDWGIDQKEMSHLQGSISLSAAGPLEAEGTQTRLAMYLQNNCVKASASVILPSAMRTTEWGSISVLVHLLPFGPFNSSIKKIRHLKLTAKRRGGVGKKKEDDFTFRCMFPKLISSEKILVHFLIQFTAKC